MKEEVEKYLKVVQALAASTKAMVALDMHANIDHISTVLDMTESNLNILAYYLERMDTRISAIGGMTDDDLHG